MGHSLLRPMAIILGLMNAAAMIHGATFVLFAQDVMGVGPFVFGIIGFGGAIGGLIGGWIAPSISQRFGSGTALAVSVGVMTIVPLLIGLIATWPVVLVLFGVESLFIILWNVITVSLRQTIIPEDLLGPGQQRLPILRLGNDPVRRRDRGHHRVGGRTSCRS